MRTLQLGFVSLLLSASLAAGCRQEVESTDIRTTGVYPVIDVTAEGSGTSRVLVKLKVGGINSNTYLELTGPDRLTATGAGATKDLDSTGSVSYGATFATEAAGPFVVSFIRGPEDDSAPNSTVDLPEPFIVSLGSTTELSRATGDLVFTWTPGPAAGVIDSSLYGNCIDTIIETIPDDGTATISHDRIHARDGATTDSCSVTLTLARTDVGQVDPAFTEGGRVTASQIRSALFTSTP
jgi:hypothetical protein